MSAKVGSTYKINEEMRQKLQASSANLGISMTKLLENLILMLDEKYPTKVMIVVRTDPLFLKGGDWEGAYTGNIRVIYPNEDGLYLRNIEFFVKDRTFHQFTEAFSDEHEKLMKLFG